MEKTKLEKLEEALKDGPILPVEVPRAEYNRVVNYLIAIGFFKDLIN